MNSRTTEKYFNLVDVRQLDNIFEIQEDSVVATLAATNVGQNADIVVGAGSTVSGLSGMELDSDSAVATTAQLRIHSLERRPDNEIGANANWLVIINEHEFNLCFGNDGIANHCLATTLRRPFSQSDCLGHEN